VPLVWLHCHDRQVEDHKLFSFKVFLVCLVFFVPLLVVGHRHAVLLYYLWDGNRSTVAYSHGTGL
jgi:hypothetical protein